MINSDVIFCNIHRKLNYVIKIISYLLIIVWEFAGKFFRWTHMTVKKSVEHVLISYFG